MTTDCFVVNEDISIFEVIEIFAKESFHIFPVIDKNTVVVGVLTREAIFKYLDSLDKQTWDYSK